MSEALNTIRIVNLNILGHCLSAGSQAARAEDLGRAILAQGGDFAVLNEVESSYEIAKIAYFAQMEIAVKAVASKNPTELTTILAKPGQKIDGTTDFPLDKKGEHRGALIVTQDGVAIAGAHWAYRLLRDVRLRNQQSEYTLKATEKYKKVLLAVDFNAEPWMKCRDNLTLSGFTCSQEILNEFKQTFANPEFKDTINWFQFLLTRLYACSIDGIYGKGFEFTDSFRFATETDHFGETAEAVVADKRNLSTGPAGSVVEFATIPPGLLVPTSA